MWKSDQIRIEQKRTGLLLIFKFRGRLKFNSVNIICIIYYVLLNNDDFYKLRKFTRIFLDILLPYFKSSNTD
jgi:hypothetical protein